MDGKCPRYSRLQRDERSSLGDAEKWLGAWKLRLAQDDLRGRRANVLERECPLTVFDLLAEGGHHRRRLYGKDDV